VTSRTGGAGIFVHDRRTGRTEQVSVARDGTPSSGYFPTISADGRYVAFVSYANNLVKGDTNEALDVFVHDRRSGRTERVSVTSGGRQAGAHYQWSFVSAGGEAFPNASYTSDSVRPAISARGRYVAFVSDASNLAPGDRNGKEDVFIRDRRTGRTTRMRAFIDGGEGKARNYSPSLSADGRYVAFQSRAERREGADSGLHGDIFVHDRWTGKTTRVNVATARQRGDYRDSYCPSLSGDGRLLAFGSDNGDVEYATSGYGDILVYDRRTRKAAPVRTGKPGRPGRLYPGRESHHPSVSGNGRYVSFVSSAGDLVAGDTNGRQDIFVRDRQTKQTERVSVASGGTQGNASSGSPTISADGRYVVFDSYASNLVVGDTNGVRDVFVRDRQTGKTERVSVASGGAQGNGASHHPALSADGRYVAFASAATNLVPHDTNGREDIFVHDRQTGQTTRVSITSDGVQVEYGDSHSPSLSADGRCIAFGSDARGLVATYTVNWGNIYIHDQQTGRTELISMSSTRNIGGQGGDTPSLSADGQCVTFVSFARELVDDDTNGVLDIFVRDRQRRQTQRVSVASTGAEANAGSYSPALSGDGRYVAFVSSASNLVVGSTGGRRGVFVHDRQTGRTERVSVPDDSAKSDAESYHPSLSADGQYVAFAARSRGPGGDATKAASDVFVRDRQTGRTERVSVASDGPALPIRAPAAVGPR
jgi:Tol biopolymer transport system component